MMSSVATRHFVHFYFPDDKTLEREVSDWNLEEAVTMARKLECDGVRPYAFRFLTMKWADNQANAREVDRSYRCWLGSRNMKIRRAPHPIKRRQPRRWNMRAERCSTCEHWSPEIDDGGWALCGQRQTRTRFDGGCADYAQKEQME